MIPLNRNLLKLKRSGIRAYSALAAETPGCISLTLGEPEFDTPAPITAAGKAALDGGKTHYAPNAGLMDLRRAIAKAENREPEEILVTIGASGALFTALLGVVVNLHFPKFDYINETVVIKQSMSTMICMFGSMAVVLVLALLYALLLSASVAPTLFLAVCLVLLVIVCVLMWRYLGHGGSARFAALQAD